MKVLQHLLCVLLIPQQCILDDNHIGEEGGEAIGEALKENKGLITLDLSNIIIGFNYFSGYNQIGDVGGKAIGIGLRLNKNLKKIDLRIYFINMIK